MLEGNLDLKKIEYFLKIAETLSYNKAAEQLHITHQALSRQIQLLEAGLDVRLFERTTAKVLLTEVGEKLYAIMKPRVESLYQGFQEIEDFITYKKDTLRIGYFNALPYQMLITPVLRYITEKKAELLINLQATDIRRVRDMLQQDKIDMAITLKFENQEWDGISYIPILAEPLQIIVSEKHPWYKKGHVTEEDIRKEDLLIYDDHVTGKREYFMPGLKVHERIPVQNYDVYMGMLEQGKSFGIISKSYGLREGTFKLLDLPKQYVEDVQIICAYKRLHPLAKVLETLRELKFGT